MQQRTQQLAQLVVDNRQELAVAYKGKFVGNDKLAVSALTWALAGKRVDAASVLETLSYLKSQAKAFSAERGENEQTLVNYMAMSGDKAAYLARVRAVFAKIMEGKKIASNSRFGEAIVIANNTSTNEEAVQMAVRAEELFAAMREAHSVITDDRDRTFAAILALSRRDPEALLADAEECYQLLADGYKMTEGRQTMANVLSLSPAAPVEKVARVRELRDAFKANKISIGWTSSQEHAVLALLASDDRPASEIGADVAEIIAFLKKQKGFGGLALNGGMRLLIAAMISSFGRKQLAESDSVATAISMAIVQAIMDWILFFVVITVV